ncbi:hypothetical protein N7462_004605 [Penicillium macrosclerotiorum]|uniref:uncharacterized protein n=1 Tax=Penicillium macrosclerotiorum TaxID=303699 RepID=UPI002548F942|nr:uncharacterized protein N7462_004605 [Penicillium macrosclerotiorum]KAJ5690213.1 hypothetical protein N7462_004605 [Penicillium macrosclerotiorum]
MSLNGLDTPAIVEAYQGALADAGGWFLLHYIARDEVALLERGTSGVPEVRNAIENYEEISPSTASCITGGGRSFCATCPRACPGSFKVVLAHIAPRSNVQFQSVLDKFTPNDTVLPLSQASDLNESALSSACLLHTASGSITSSSSSLRRRRLMEITEDAEESGAKEETKAQSPLQPPPKAESRQRSGSQKSEATIVPTPTMSSEVETPSPDLQPPPSRASSRAPPSIGSMSESPSTISPKSPDSSSDRSRYRNILDEFPRPSEEVRMSTQSARPSLRDLERAAGITPKVKLGPRPSVDGSGRPRTAGTSRNPDQRPVASMPAGMRSSSVRKPPSIEVPRPRSQGSSFATRPNSRAPPIPPLLVPPPSIPISRPQLSPGAKSLGALSTSSGLTPEKERLMKALQQRKKQMAKRAEETKKKQAIPEADEETKTQKEATLDQEENKENINLATKLDTPDPEPQHATEPELQPGPEKQQENEVAEEPVGPQVQAPEPPIEGPELPVEASIPPSQEQPTAEAEKKNLVYLESSNPEPITDIAVTDFEGGSCSHTSAPSADTIFSTEITDTSSEVLKSETPQTLPEEISEESTGDETHVEHADSAVVDPIETTDDLLPPSVNVEVPLAKDSADVPDSTPELENASPLQQLEIPAVADEQLDEKETDLPTENPAAGSPELVNASPSVDSPPSPVAEPTVAPVSVSIDPVPLDDFTPEPPRTTKNESLPLDQRRKIHLEPIQVLTPEYSDDDQLLSDDSFMEELRSATVQQARPVAVKSPNGGDQSWRGSRAVSSPYGLPSPSAMHALAARSLSSSYSENGPATPVLMAKKINVSSGISNRIKALEKFSSREGTPSTSTPPVTGPSASSSFESLRKRASVSFPNGAAPDFSRAPSVNHHESRSTPANTRRTNSISVTARIIRDTAVSPGSSGVEPSESDVLNLQASQLTVEHGTANEPLSNSSTFDSSTNLSENRSMSISSTGSSRQAAQVSSRPASRLSLSSRAKTDETLQSSSPTDEKKSSRASRLMRRMSSITSTSRRSIIGALSPSVKEEDAVTSPISDFAISPSSSHPRLAEPIDIGEVNVQFPETLLWKRRFMRIDENGYVVLAPGTNDATARNMTKRYHLTEFRTPCLPDEDMQELPNSILLDFLDGSTLQCACESRQGQSWTLTTLVDAHNAHRQ